MVLYYKSILYLELICHGAGRSQHENENPPCSVGVQRLKGRCQSLPGNLSEMLFLSSCSPHSLNTKLSFGWKPAGTAKERHKQQSSPETSWLIIPSVWKYWFVINLQCSATCSQLGTLKLKTHHQSTTGLT